MAWNSSLFLLCTQKKKKKKKRETKENKTFTWGRRKPLHKSFTWSLCCLGSIQAEGFGLGKFGFVGLVQAWVRGFVALCFCFWPLWVFVVFVLISYFVWFLLWSLIYVCVFFISLIVCKNSWIFFFFEGEQEETRRRRRDSCFLISWFSFVELESLRLEFHVDFHRNRVFDTWVATVILSLK